MLRRTESHWRGLLVATTAASLVFLVVLAACGGTTSTPVPPGPAMDHTNIVLRNAAGDPLTVASTEPYSPRQTCGACHNVDQIANGYHFQQGRTNAAGTIQTADNFFGDGREFLKSDGMYGKW